MKRQTYSWTLAALLVLGGGCSDDTKPLGDRGVDHSVDAALDLPPADQAPPDSAEHDIGDATADHAFFEDQGQPDSDPSQNSDNCATAETLTWNGTTIVKQVDTTTATDTVDAFDCTEDGTPGRDRFFEITLPAGSYRILLQAPPDRDPALYLIGSGCSANDVTTCADIPDVGDEELIVSPTTQQTLIIGVDAWDDAEADVYTLIISELGATDAGPDQGEDAGPPDQGDEDSFVVPQIVITEILYDCTAVADPDGEWIELHNPGAAAVDLAGWTLEDNAGSHTIGVLSIPAGGYAVLAYSDDSGSNGGVSGAYEYGSASGILLGNGGDIIKLRDSGGNLVDMVDVDEVPWPIAQGASLQLKSPTLDNDLLTNWCVAENAWAGSAGDKGTPGEANDCQ